MQKGSFDRRVVVVMDRTDGLSLPIEEGLERASEPSESRCGGLNRHSSSCDESYLNRLALTLLYVSSICSYLYMEETGRSSRSLAAPSASMARAGRNCRSCAGTQKPDSVPQKPLKWAGILLFSLRPFCGRMNRSILYPMTPHPLKSIDCLPTICSGGRWISFNDVRKEVLV